MIYKIFNGFDHFKQCPLFQVIGTNNDYVGEWHNNLTDAEIELKNLTPA